MRREFGGESRVEGLDVGVNDDSSRSQLPESFGERLEKRP